jgi:hypothetical protein
MDDMFSLPVEPTSRVKIKKIRAPKHDFKDGNGKIFAHRHANGGGWVADTAYVSPAAQVTRNAQVYGLARVYDDCRVTGNSRVFGRAKLTNSAVTSHYAQISGLAVCDASRVSAFGNVTGNASLSDSSTIEGHAVVDGFAVLRNTHLRGPRARGFAKIGGNALLSNSFVYGLTTINGDVVVVNGRISDVYLSGSAAIFNSTVHSVWPYLHNSFLSNNRTTIPPDFIALTTFNPTAEATDIQDRVIDAMAASRLEFHGTAVRSEIRLPRCSVRDNVIFVQSRVTFFESSPRHVDTHNFFSDALDISAECHLFGNVRANNVHDLRNFIDRDPAVTAEAASSRGTAPVNLEIVRQRRLLRLEAPTA